MSIKSEAVYSSVPGKRVVVELYFLKCSTFLVAFLCLPLSSALVQTMFFPPQGFADALYVGKDDMVVQRDVNEK